MTLDLSKGLTTTDQYSAWKFPGGEIHFKLSPTYVTSFIKEVRGSYIEIFTKLNTSDDIMFLLIVNDTLKKDYKNIPRRLLLPYVPYQQADRNFGVGECFSLKTMTNLLNTMEFDEVIIGMPHSDVTPGLLNNCVVIDNTEFIREVMGKINIPHEDLIICAPDAGAYKLIYKLCEKIGFNGDIMTCSKSRNHETGELTMEIPTCDVSKSVLIIDDIALGSRTFLNIRKELKNEKVYLAVSHGIFNENIDKLEESFECIFSTNSRSNEPKGDKFEIIDIF